MESDASLRVWLALGLAKTIPQESFHFPIKNLQDSHHQLIIFITIWFWISFFSSDKQKFQRNNLVKLVVKACSVLLCPVFAWTSFVFELLKACLHENLLHLKMSIKLTLIVWSYHVVILKLLHCNSVALFFFLSFYQSMKFINFYSGEY